MRVPLTKVSVIRNLAEGEHTMRVLFVVDEEVCFGLVSSSNSSTGPRFANPMPDIFTVFLLSSMCGISNTTTGYSTLTLG